MGSSKRKTMFEPRVNAYGKNMPVSEARAIDNHNNAEVNRGQNLDNNAQNVKKAAIQQEGTIDYKKYLKKRSESLLNVLGVGK